MEGEDALFIVVGVLVGESDVIRARAGGGWERRRRADNLSRLVLGGMTKACACEKTGEGGGDASSVADGPGGRE